MFIQYDTPFYDEIDPYCPECGGLEEDDHRCDLVPCNWCGCPIVRGQYLCDECEVEAIMSIESPAGDDLRNGYPANTHRWKQGEWVIHAWDAKTQNMILEVIGYTDEGLVQCRYVYGDDKKIRKLDLGDLLSPGKFGLIPF